MDHEPSSASARKSLPPWLLESLFIVLSVALGYAVTQYTQAQSDSELRRRVLRGLQEEVEYNLQVLEPQLALHQRWLQALAKVGDGQDGQTARDVFLATWPDFNPTDIRSPFRLLQRGAWDAALSTGALELIDYDLVANLSEIYQWQHSLEAAVDKLPFHATTFFDSQTRSAAVRQFAFQLDAIKLTEGFLVKTYRDHLPAIRAGAAAGN
jgi:hypothetical protein